MSGAGNKSIDVQSLPGHPELPKDGSTAGAVKQETLTVTVHGKTLNIFSRQTSPEGSPRLTVLLLHGQAFTSKNWEDIGTLQFLALWGYRAIGVDLPGYGNSGKESLGGVSGADFMCALVEKIGSRPVIISPSMSGGFSLPYLFENPHDSCKKAVAYVPVAPVSTGRFRDKYPQSEIPTLIVYGSRDENLGFTSRDHLQALPKAQTALIPDAGHACYMNQPALFHTVLCHFLSDLSA